MMGSLRQLVLDINMFNSWVWGFAPPPQEALDKYQQTNKNKREHREKRQATERNIGPGQGKTLVIIV